MRKSWVLAISLLSVLVLLIGVGAVACGGNGDENGTPPPGDGNGAPSEDESELPQPGEWVASTGSSEFTFTFNVSPDGSGISSYTYEFEEFGFCGDYRVGKMTGVYTGAVPIHPLPSGAEFSLVHDIQVYSGQDEDPFTGMSRMIHIYWHIFIEGEFDETGTHASGTWRVSSEGKLDFWEEASETGGTTCAEGSWEASAP